MLVAGCANLEGSRARRVADIDRRIAVGRSYLVSIRVNARGEVLQQTTNHISGRAAVERAARVDRQSVAVGIDYSKLHDARECKGRAAGHGHVAVQIYA